VQHRQAFARRVELVGAQGAEAGRALGLVLGDAFAAGLAPRIFDAGLLVADGAAALVIGRGPGQVLGNSPALRIQPELRSRMTRNGLFGMVAFANTETLSNEQADENLVGSFAAAGGFGFRFMLNKRSKTNLCFDIGFGRDGLKGVYFGVQEAF
jgi:hypothetical protein